MKIHFPKKIEWSHFHFCRFLWLNKKKLMLIYVFVSHLLQYIVLKYIFQKSSPKQIMQLEKGGVFSQPFQVIADILCNMESETISVKSLYSFTLKICWFIQHFEWIFFYQCMILKHHALLIWKIGSLSYAALPNVFPFYFTVLKDYIC